MSAIVHDCPYCEGRMELIEALKAETVRLRALTNIAPSTIPRGTIEVSQEELYQLQGLIGDLEESLAFVRLGQPATHMAEDCEHAVSLLTHYRNRILKSLTVVVN